MGWGTREILSRPSPAKGFGKPVSTFVDAALTLDELIERIGLRFVDCRVAHDPRPLAPCSFVGLGRVCRAPDDRGERENVDRIEQLGLLPRDQ